MNIITLLCSLCRTISLKTNSSPDINMPNIKSIKEEPYGVTKESNEKVHFSQLNEFKQFMQMVMEASFQERKDDPEIQQLLDDCLHETVVHDVKRSGKNKLLNDKHSGTEFSWKPIGYMKSPFAQKSGTPRQGCLVATSRGLVTISSDIFSNPHHSLLGLKHYSHVWLMFLFHDNGTGSKGFTKAKVAPPRLGGQKLGVFATRSPHRPNPIGLTLAKLDAVIGNTIHVSGVDLLSGTPILDIKPYIPAYDDPAYFSGSDDKNCPAEDITPGKDSTNDEEKENHDRCTSFGNDGRKKAHWNKRAEKEGSIHCKMNSRIDEHNRCGEVNCNGSFPGNYTPIVDKHMHNSFDIKNQLQKTSDVDHAENADLGKGLDCQHNDLRNAKINFGEKFSSLSLESKDINSVAPEETVPIAKRSQNLICEGGLNDANGVVSGECKIGSGGNDCEIVRDKNLTDFIKRSDVRSAIHHPNSCSEEITSDLPSSSSIEMPALDCKPNPEKHKTTTNILDDLSQGSLRKVKPEVTTEIISDDNTHISYEKVDNLIVSGTQNPSPQEKSIRNEYVMQGSGVPFPRLATSEQLRNAAQEEHNLRALCDKSGVKTAPWLETARQKCLEVIINPVAEKQLQLFSSSAENEIYRLKHVADSAALRSLIVSSIASDVRSQYRRVHCADLLYHYRVDCVRVTAAFLGEGEAEILRVNPAAGSQ